MSHRKRDALRLRLLKCALPMLAVGLAYALTKIASPSQGFGAGGGFVGLAMILGTSAVACASLLEARGETPQGRWLHSVALEGMGVLLGVLMLALICSCITVPSRHPDQASSFLPAISLVAAAWIVPWSCGLPLRALGYSSCARVLSLGVAAVMLGSPWLSSEAYDVPDWVGRINPLVRWHQDVLFEDWFHGPLLYSRVGEGFYTTPAWNADLLTVLLGAALLVVAAAALAKLAERRQRRV